MNARGQFHGDSLLKPILLALVLLLAAGVAWAQLVPGQGSLVPRTGSPCGMSSPMVPNCGAMVPGVASGSLTPSSCPDSVPAFAASAGYNTCTFASTFPNLNRIDTANIGTSTTSTDWWPADGYRPDVTGAFTNPGGNLSINVGSGLTFANNNPNLSTIYYPAYQISQATWAANVATIKIGYTLTAISCAANVVTATTDATHAYAALNWVTITGNTPAGYNGLVRITGTPAGNQFTYAVAACPGVNTILGIADGHTYQTGNTLRMRSTTPSAYNVTTTAITRVDANHYTFPLAISDPGPGTVLGIVVPTTDLYRGRTFTHGALFRYTVAFDQTLNSAAGGSGGTAPGFPALWLSSFPNNVATGNPGHYVEIDAYECLGHNDGSCQQAFLAQDNDYTSALTLSGSLTWAGGSVTVPANNHGFLTGNWVSVHACSIAAYNAGAVKITSTSTNSFTYALTPDPGGGTPTGCAVNGNNIASTGPSVPAASELCPVTVAGCSSVTGPLEDGVTFHTFDVLWVPASKNGGTGKIWRYFDGNHLGTQDINYFTNAAATYGSGTLDQGTNWTGIWSEADTGALPAGFFLMLTAGNTAGGGNWPLIVKNVQVWQSSISDAILFNGTSGPSYTGPGDVVGAKAWIGLRAYSAADRGNRLVNACNSTGGGDVCVDLLSDAATGNLVSQSVNGGTCPGTNCTVKIFYDRSGLNLCGAGSACDYTQNTVAGRATLVANCIGALPCARAAGAQSYTSLNFPAQAQPLTLSTVARRNPSSSAQQGLFSFSTGNFQLGWPASVNQMFMYSGNALPLAAASDTNPHSVQAMYDSAGSPSIYIDGTSTPMTLSATLGIQASAGTLLADTALSTFLTGDFYEGGMWAGAFTGGQQSSMYANQKAYWPGVP